jgi:hypothetical protein
LTAFVLICPTYPVDMIEGHYVTSELAVMRSGVRTLQVHSIENKIVWKKKAQLKNRTLLVIAGDDCMGSSPDACFATLPLAGFCRFPCASRLQDHSPPAAGPCFEKIQADGYESRSTKRVAGRKPCQCDECRGIGEIRSCGLVIESPCPASTF